MPRVVPIPTRRASACAAGSGSVRTFSTIREIVAVVAMGFCFPGLDAKGGDLPPRRECAELWRKPMFAALPNLELILLVGQYAQKWHLGPKLVGKSLSETVARWRDIYHSTDHPRLVPMPHPSWRNNAWLKRNPWFETELLPVLRADIARIVASTSTVAPAPRAVDRSSVGDLRRPRLT